MNNLQKRLPEKSKSVKIYEIKDAIIRQELLTVLAELSKKSSSMKPDRERLLKKAMFELFLGFSADAIETAKQALSLNEASLFAWYLLGSAYLDNGRTDYAKSAYDNAMKYVGSDGNLVNEQLVINDIFTNLKMMESNCGKAKQ